MSGISIGTEINNSTSIGDGAIGGAGLEDTGGATPSGDALLQSDGSSHIMQSDGSSFILLA